MRDYEERFAALDLLDAPDQWDNITQRATVPLLHPSPRRRWRPIWVAAAAAIVTILLIGGVSLLIDPTDEVGPAVTESPVPTTVSSTVPPTIATTEAPAVSLQHSVGLEDVATVVLQLGDGTTSSPPEGCTNIRAREIDHQGRVWATDVCGGLYRLDGDTWVTLFESRREGGRPATILEDVDAPDFWDIIEAPDRTIWVNAIGDVLTYDNGEWSKIRPWRFIGPPRGRFFDDPADTAVPMVEDLALDARGTPWAVHGDRVMRWDGQAWRQVEDAPPDVKRIALDAEGQPWVATTTALHRLAAEGWVSFPYPDHGPGGWWWVQALAASPDGQTAWVSVEHADGESRERTAFWSLTGGVWTSFEFGGIGRVGVLPDGSVWATGGDGVFLFDGAAWTRYVMPEAEPGGGVAGVTDDGSLWFEPPFQLIRYQLPER